MCQDKNKCVTGSIILEIENTNTRIKKIKQDKDVIKRIKMCRIMQRGSNRGIIEVIDSPHSSRKYKMIKHNTYTITHICTPFF